MTERHRPAPIPPREGEAPVRSEPSPAEQRVAQAMGLLERGIERAMSEEGFAGYLKMLGRFHEYSFRNVLLIAMQRPDAARVAGYRKWQELGRQVRKGEKGITILVPHIVKDRDKVNEEGTPTEKLVGFGTGYVFDIAQTEGKALPAPPIPETLSSESERSMALSRALERYAARSGALVERDPAFPANGAYFPDAKRIVVNADLPGDQATKTLAHEVAHFVAAHDRAIPRADAETVAESAAFVVLHHFGLDSGRYTFPYVAAWARDKQVLQRNLGAIQQTSHRLIAGVEQALSQEQGRECDIVILQSRDTATE